MDAQQAPIRTVVVVNIKKGCKIPMLFDDMYKSLMELLKNNPLLRVVTVDSVDELKQEVAAKPSVLLFTNELVAKIFNIQDIMKSFVSAGGLAIFGCSFSSLTEPEDMETLFCFLRLPWKTSEAYNGTTFGITTVGKFILRGFQEPSFSGKALQLSGVTPEQALYIPLPGSPTQSHVFAPTPTNPKLAMAAFARIGKGAIAYVGDDNAEDGSLRLINALCLASW